MRILGLIPARGGSKGIPQKNIRPLSGRPLLHYTAEIALMSELLTDVILSSDDNEIIDCAKAAGVSVPFSRPSEISQDDTPSIDVVKHALDWYASKGIQYDAVCLLQVTSPFRTVDFLDSAIAKFIDSGCDSLISVRKVPHHYNPHWTFEAAENGNLRIATGEKNIIARRQDLPDAFHRDGSIYITRSETILDRDSLFGDSIAYIESPADTYVNIDTAEDWKLAESIAAKIFRG